MIAINHKRVVSEIEAALAGFDALSRDDIRELLLRVVEHLRQGETLHEKLNGYISQRLAEIDRANRESRDDA